MKSARGALGGGAGGIRNVGGTPTESGGAHNSREPLRAQRSLQPIPLDLQANRQTIGVPELWNPQAHEAYLKGRFVLPAS